MEPAKRGAPTARNGDAPIVVLDRLVNDHQNYSLDGIEHQGLDGGGGDNWPQIEIIDLVTHLLVNQQVADFRRRQTFVERCRLADDGEVTIVAHSRFLIAAKVCFAGDCFDLDIGGVAPEPAFVLGALDRVERLVDLVAWPEGRPSAMATLGGHSAILGSPQVALPPSLSLPLRVHSTAERWLLSSFEGCVAIDHAEAASKFLDRGGELIAENRSHARELSRQIEKAQGPIRKKPPSILYRECAA